MGSACYSARSMMAGGGDVQPVAPLDNRISEGGKPHVLEDWVDLAIYARDAATIRNNFFQLAKQVERLQAAMKAAGIPV